MKVKVFVIYIVFIKTILFSLSYEIKSTVFPEASGICMGKMNKGIIYTHNDSGGEPIIYSINTKGELVYEYYIKGLKNRDWEDIASGPGPDRKHNYLYIGEIGDNRAKYASVFIYRIKEKLINKDTKSDSISDYDTIEFTYEDGPRDAEALFVDPQSLDIYVISKREEQVGVYMLAYPQSLNRVNIAKRIGHLPLQWVTAADINQKGNKILVKTYLGIWLWERLETESIESVFKKSAKPLDYEIETQGEGLCFDQEDLGYFTLSEKADNATQKLYHYLLLNQ